MEGKIWILWPKSWNISDSSPSTALDLTPTFPRDPEWGQFSFAFKILPVFHWGFGNGINSQKAPKGSRIRRGSIFFLPTRKQARDCSRIFREFRLFSLALGERQENGEYSSPGPFFWGAPAGSELCSRAAFPWEFPTSFRLNCLGARG